MFGETKQRAKQALMANELRIKVGVSVPEAATLLRMGHQFMQERRHERQKTKRQKKLLEKDVATYLNTVWYPNPRMPQNKRRMEEVNRQVKNAKEPKMPQGQVRKEGAKPDGWISHRIKWEEAWVLQECEQLTQGLLKNKTMWNHGDKDLAEPEASDLPSCFFPLCTDINALCMPCNCEQTHRKGRPGQGTLSQTATETSNTTEENCPPQPIAADVISEGHWQRRCRCINPNKAYWGIGKGMLSIGGVVNKPLRSYKEAVMECVKIDYREDRWIYIESAYASLPGTCTVLKSKLEEQFEAFAEKMRTWIKSGSATDAVKLTLYGFYKQAVYGDCSISPPWRSWAKAKYDAWMERKGLSKVQAMEGYITEAQRQIDT
jgi:acyl-CoA-binding protein